LSKEGAIGVLFFADADLTEYGGGTLKGASGLLKKSVARSDSA